MTLPIRRWPRVIYRWFPKQKPLVKNFLRAAEQTVFVFRWILFQFNSIYQCHGIFSKRLVHQRTIQGVISTAYRGYGALWVCRECRLTRKVLMASNIFYGLYNLISSRLYTMCVAADCIRRKNSRSLKLVDFIEINCGKIDNLKIQSPGDVHTSRRTFSSHTHRYYVTQCNTMNVLLFVFTTTNWKKKNLLKISSAAVFCVVRMYVFVATTKGTRNPQRAHIVEPTKAKKKRFSRIQCARHTTKSISKFLLSTFAFSLLGCFACIEWLLQWEMKLFERKYLRSTSVNIKQFRFRIPLCCLS